MLAVAGVARLPLAPTGVASILGIAAAIGLARLGDGAVAMSSCVLIAVAIATGDRVLATSSERPPLALDATIGAMTAMTFLPTTPAVALGALLAFRILDLMRPLGIAELANLSGGAGLIMPAFAAGVLANIAVELLIVVPELSH